MGEVGGIGTDITAVAVKDHSDQRSLHPGIATPATTPLFGGTKLLVNVVQPAQHDGHPGAFALPPAPAAELNAVSLRSRQDRAAPQPPTTAAHVPPPRPQPGRTSTSSRASTGTKHSTPGIQHGKELGSSWWTGIGAQEAHAGRPTTTRTTPRHQPSHLHRTKHERSVPHVARGSRPRPPVCRRLDGRHAIAHRHQRPPLRPLLWLSWLRPVRRPTERQRCRRTPRLRFLRP